MQMPLIKILPEQVSEAWEIVAPAIAKALPPGSALHPYSLTNILQSILAEKSILWGWFKKAEDSTPIILVLTQEITDDLVGIRNLLIYAIASLSPATDRAIWTEGVATLVKFAKSRNCRNILAYSNHSGLIDLMEGQGWSTEFSLLTYGV